MGLYRRVAASIGRLGFVGFVLAVAGCALLVGVTFAEAFLLPVIAINQPAMPQADWLELAGPLAGAVVVSVVALACFNLGLVVLGVTAEYSRALPRGTGFLLAVAALLTNGEFAGPVGFMVYVGSGIIFGLTLAWWGRWLVGLGRRNELARLSTADGPPGGT
jgi:hypothetical protein